MYIYIYTLGCRLNLYESEAITDQLIKNGYTITEFPDQADIIIINSCTVTSKADSKSKYAIRKLKKMSNNGFVVLTGCMVDTDLNDIINTIPEVDLFVKNKDKDSIIDIITNISVWNKKKIFTRTDDQDGSFNFDILDQTKHARAILKIQDGCDNYCSYCKIPFARGNPRSKTIESIYSDINKLKINGFNEIVLSGINILKYDYKGLKIGELIKSLTRDFSELRFRLSSIEPQSVDDSFLEAISNKSICPHFHLSLQNGSDTILLKMNRNYTTERYFDIVNTIRSLKDNPFISTDVIIGFPGETDQDFNKTVNFIERIRFADTHVFPYSIRKETKAALLPFHVATRQINERVKILKNIVNKLNKIYIESTINKTYCFIVETALKDRIEGRSENFIKAEFITNQIIHRKSVFKGKISKYKDNIIYGEII